MYWPKVSMKKREELMILKTNLKNSPVKKSYSATRKHN